MGGENWNTVDTGNLGLFVDDSKLARPHFSLAPVYDMLSMRWRPDLGLGAPDYSPFEPNPLSLQNKLAAQWAYAFWRTLKDHPSISEHLRDTSKKMQVRCAT